MTNPKQFVGQPQKPVPNNRIKADAGDSGVVLMSGLLLAAIIFRATRKTS